MGRIKRFQSKPSLACTHREKSELKLQIGEAPFVVAACRYSVTATAPAPLCLPVSVEETRMKHCRDCRWPIHALDNAGEWLCTCGAATNIAATCVPWCCH
jgi:hypothetical protein